MPAVKLALVTWNVGGASTPTGVPHDAALLLRGLGAVARIIVVGLQEVSRPGRGWKATLLRALPSGWVAAGGSRYMGMRVVVLIHKDVRTFITPIRAMRMGSGVGDRWPNKGAVAVVLRFGASTSVCFVVAHLAAQEGNLRSRADDYVNIVRRLQGDENAGPSVPLFLRYEHVFVMGDLNYRLSPPAAAGASLALRVRWVDQRVKAQDWIQLAAIDELADERDRANVFVNFNEGPLRFPPTFKYDPGAPLSAGYNPSRIPSYCDRILWHSLTARRPFLRQTAYTSLDNVRSSDHRPVRALFDLHVPNDSARLTVKSPVGRRVVLEFTYVSFRRGKRKAKHRKAAASAPTPDVSRRRAAPQADSRSPGGLHGGEDAQDDENDPFACLRRRRDADSDSSDSSSSSSSPGPTMSDMISNGSSSSCSSDEEGELASQDPSPSRRRGRSASGYHLSPRRTSSCGEVRGLHVDRAALCEAVVSDDNDDTSIPRHYGDREEVPSSSSDDEPKPRQFVATRSLPLLVDVEGRTPQEEGLESPERLQGPTPPMPADRNAAFARRRRAYDGAEGLSSPPNVVKPRQGLAACPSFDSFPLCYSGSGGLTTDGTDEPVKRDSLSEEVRQAELAEAMSSSKSKSRKDKRLRYWFMDVHGGSVFLSGKRSYTTELYKQADGSRACRGDCLPAIPLFPVGSVEDLRHEHVQISFWRVKSRIGTSGVLPLGELLSHPPGEPYSFELQLTKYGRPAGTLEASVQLVVSSSRLWVDSMGRVVRDANGTSCKKYRGPLAVRGKRDGSNISSHAARTAQSARSATKRVAHKLDSFGYDKSESQVVRK